MERRVLISFLLKPKFLFESPLENILVFLFTLHVPIMFPCIVYSLSLLVELIRIELHLNQFYLIVIMFAVSFLSPIIFAFAVVCF